MTEQNLRTLIAGQREAGVPCAHCSQEVQLGQPTVVCGRCGTLHHASCWQSKSYCGGYDCATAADLSSAGKQVLSISRDDLASARPLPSRISAEASQSSSADGEKASPRWNRTAVAAFVVSLLGVPLFGIVTGLLAIVMGCIALAGHSRARRGFALAVLAVVIGLFEVVGWAVGLSYYFGGAHAMVALDELTLDPESLEELPERIARAMKANVVIQTAAGLGRQGMGSGVILRIRDGMAYIVTNRHVVDHSYTDRTRTVPNNLDELGQVDVMTVEQVPVRAKIEWVAPYGVDLAIVSAPVDSPLAQEAYWAGDAAPHIGDEVFAVGNPHGLGWTHSAGDISQIRRRTSGTYDFRILQTTAAINPGNSGGGLYDAQGRLIGINTLTSDKRFAEGLGFAISFLTLLDLVPEDLELPASNPEAPPK